MEKGAVDVYFKKNVTIFAKRVVGVVMFIHSHLHTLSEIPKSCMYHITRKVVV